ncbi:MAG: twin-arginine translocase subunit TatC [Fimbriiglobus sp.]
MPPSTDYPDDIFADTRMSIGDHIDELRTRLIRALIGLGVILLAGFALDGIGQAAGNSNIGVGRPMMKVIVEPVQSQLQVFYSRRNEKAAEKLAFERTPQERAAVLSAKLKEQGLESMTRAEVAELRTASVKMPVFLPVAPLAKVFGPPKDPTVTEIAVEMEVYPAYLNYINKRAETLLEDGNSLKTLSAQEAFVVYFQVSLLCGFVIGSPWIFYQVWAFVAAGLYPHERGYMYRSLGPAVALFISGALVCQFLVLPGAVKALLGFNEWIDLDPDIRLREWLGFALILPLVFGVSFQTPLVMFVMNRLGTFSAQDYLKHWRMAVMVIAVFSAVITPTPDVFTMSYLFVPMFGLYMVGIAICWYFPPDHEAAWKEDEQVAV